MRVVTIILLNLLLISGCATPPHSCPIDLSGNRNCSPMSKVYKAALENKKTEETLIDSKNVVSTVNDQKVRAVKKNQLANNFINEEKPVFQQPRIYRLWVAPWQDEYDFMHSGEYIYFKEDGYWNYGNKKPGKSKQGVIKNIFEPIDTSKPSFKVIKKTTDKTSNPKKVF